MSLEDSNHVLDVAMKALDKTIPAQTFVGVARIQADYKKGWRYMLHKETPATDKPTPKEDLELEVQLAERFKGMHTVLEINITPLPSFGLDDIIRHIRYKFPDFTGRTISLVCDSCFVLTSENSDEITSLACETIFMLALTDMFSK